METDPVELIEDRAFEAWVANESQTLCAARMKALTDATEDEREAFFDALLAVYEAESRRQFAAAVHEYAQEAVARVMEQAEK